MRTRTARESSFALTRTFMLAVVLYALGGAAVGGAVGTVLGLRRRAKKARELRVAESRELSYLGKVSPNWLEAVQQMRLLSELGDVPMQRKHYQAIEKASNGLAAIAVEGLQGHKTAVDDLYRRAHDMVMTIENGMGALLKNVPPAAQNRFEEYRNTINSFSNNTLAEVNAEFKRIKSTPPS